jgi:hypothetical protein
MRGQTLHKTDFGTVDREKIQMVCIIKSLSLEFLKQNKKNIYFALCS